jgi:hypothetical protein
MRPSWRRNASPRERFEDRAVRTDGCWLWRGVPNKNGYQSTRISGRTTLVHRIAYELFVGPVPEDMELDHLCRNRACVNPYHLEPVTQNENWRRGTAPSAENARKTHCKYGHELAGDNLILHSGNRQCKNVQC